MSEHQALPVKGYTAQSQEKVDLVNKFKEMEERILREIDAVSALPLRDGSHANPRWVAIARTNIEQGFMALNRAIFDPQRIDLPEDKGR